jgi:hypothetical protein
MRADSLLSNLFGFINRKGEQYLLPFDTMVDRNGLIVML